MRSSFTLSLFLALVLAVGCGSLPNRRISRLTPLASAMALSHVVAQTGDSSCSTNQPSSASLDSGLHDTTIAAAYHDILREFIRPLDSSSLLNAAWQGAMDEAAKEGDGDPGVPAPQLPDSSPDADWSTFDSSYQALSRATDGQVDQLKLAFAGIAAMAKSVDEGHTYFLQPDEYAQEGREESISGIGVVLNGKQAPFVVEEVVPGAPADQAGLRPGDSFVAVDGCDVSSWDSLQLSTHVRGPAGTSVHLTLDRPTSGQYDVDITRAQVTFPAIDSQMLPQGIGYIHLHEFPAPTDILMAGKPLGPALDSILASFRDAGASGWILDLRGNPGGRVDGLQQVAGRILPPGVMFSFSDRAGNSVEERTRGNRVSDPPLVAVLVDGQSASAAEILASAVQDEGVATVIGSTTAGVANGAELLGIGDGAGISVTHWQTYTLHGRPLNGSGVTPDITVDRTATDLANGIDPPLDRAVALASGTQARGH